MITDPPPHYPVASEYTPLRFPRLGHIPDIDAVAVGDRPAFYARFSPVRFASR
jgi:hypothetical protein